MSKFDVFLWVSVKCFSWFLKTSSPFVQKTTCVRLSKENLVGWNNAPEIHTFNSWRNQKLLLVANQLQDSTFLHEIISEDVGISKLVSQLKLLPSLFELKDNDLIVMSTIIKKLQDMSRNRSFLISEVGKTVSLLLVSQATNPESDGFFSTLKRLITYLMSTTGNNRLHALTLVHVRFNILHNINLADVVNHFVDRKDSRKQAFRHFSQSYS